MSTRAQAAVVRVPDGDFVLEEVALDEPRPDEALVEVHACGICHMDIEATGMMELPCIMGHEGAGIVRRVGSEVASVQPGDRVIMGYGHCGACEPCQRNEPYFCDESWGLAFSGKRRDGSGSATFPDGQELSAAFFQQSSFASHAITPARSLVKMAGDVPWPVAAAIPCGLLTGVGTALNILNVGAESSLLVRGVGAVGMGAVVGARMRGCKVIVASDVNKARLELAGELGATATVDASGCDVDDWRKEHLPRGFSNILDTTGNAAVFTNSVDCLATGGNFAYAILPAPMEEFSFRPFGLFEKCATLSAVSFGSAAPNELLPEMLDWWRQGEFPVERLITTFPFVCIGEAIEAARAGSVLKPVLVME